MHLKTGSNSDSAQVPSCGSGSNPPSTEHSNRRASVNPRRSARSRWFPAALGRFGRAEEGEATVEFVAMAVILLIPVAYFIMTVAAVQAAVFASEAAAREGGRLLASDPTASAHVTRQVDQIFSDYGVQGSHSLQVVCDPEPCGRADFVRVDVETKVALPLIPDAFSAMLNPVIPVSSSFEMPVTRIQLIE
ncbi:MAG: hypothetical protein Q4E01_04225 [Actinomycetaceae bacterium]|nr:hypothetical protein [Actinomycetaceae bacterium]